MVARFNDAFDVTWNDPGDAKSVWAIDRIHFASPLTPLGEDYYAVVVRTGWEVRVAFANGYLFIKDFGPPPTPPEVHELGPKRIWHEKYLPLVKEICAGIRAPDYDAMSAPELAAALPELFQQSAEGFRYPTVIASTFMMPALLMAAFCDRELGPDGPVLAATLLQGFANESAAAGAGLNELAVFASGRPALAGDLRAGAYEGLRRRRGGREFLQRFHDYLDVYGWRAEEWCMFQHPTWAEDPSTPLRLITRYLTDPEHSPETAHQRAVQMRAAAAETIEARLPAAKRSEFQQHLDAAMEHVPISEERALWQLISIGSVRVPLLSLGRKLVHAGVIDEPDDIFFLRLAEIGPLAATPKPMQDATSQRKADFARYEAMEPPMSIGAPFIIEERGGPSQLVHRYFFGSVAMPSTNTVINGQAASQGVATARARVVHSLAEAGHLQQGEILVCKTTAPPWTPLFAIAAGVVTETGGILSHSAICAREYAIPCVVGTQVATSRIPDGAIITVDGSKGTVTLVSR
jgi:rifampicin phosphotransferase